MEKKESLTSTFQCGAVSDATLSDYFVDTVDGRGLYYSYENCGTPRGYSDDQCDDVEIQRVRRVEVECPDPQTGVKKRIVRAMVAPVQEKESQPVDENEKRSVEQAERCFEEQTCEDNDQSCNWECLSSTVSDEWSTCVYDAETGLCVVDRTAENSNRAIEQCGSTRGRSSCRCLGTNLQEAQSADSETPFPFVAAKINGKSVRYPANYGERCQVHAEPGFAECEGAYPAPWCRRAWCFVDPCACDVSDLERVDY